MGDPGTRGLEKEYDDEWNVRGPVGNDNDLNTPMPHAKKLIL